MATKAFKSEKIDAIKSKLEKAQVAIITEYQGLSVEDITKLRREIQKGGGDYMVTKNTLVKIAVQGTEYEALAEKMSGPIALAFGFEDPVSPAKAVAKFIKESKKGAMIGAVLDSSERSKNTLGYRGRKTKKSDDSIDYIIFFSKFIRKGVFFLI